VRKIIGPENIPASLVEEREILKKKDMIFLSSNLRSRN
jgi:hypothetical protein